MNIDITVMRGTLNFIYCKLGLLYLKCYNTMLLHQYFKKVVKSKSYENICQYK